MDWHNRYIQQARWTAQLRSYLFDKAGLASANRLLEVGCGTGAVLAELPAQANLFGIDIDLGALAQAASHVPATSLSAADAVCMPFPEGTFDIVFCHFVLLWVNTPSGVIKEMRRITRHGGVVMALAEPDYVGRIDFPDELEEVGHWQAESLVRQGADPKMGRKLAGIFSQSGLRQVESGLLGGEWKNIPAAPAERTMEWDVMISDLAGRVPLEDIRRMKRIDELAWNRGERILFVPTFYAWGVV